MFHLFRQFPLFVALAFISMLGLVAEERPNFLIIAIDDLNDYVGSLDGHPNASTPNLDRLAKQGVLFTNAHCVSPVCNPSRTAIWTGLRPTTTGIHSNPMGWFREQESTQDIVTLSQTMLQNGYSSHGYGKLYHQVRSSDDEWEQSEAFFYGPLQSPKVNYDAGWTLTDWGVPPVKDAASHDAEIAQHTIDTLLGSHDRPLFIGCGFYRPHTPMYAEQVWFDRHPLNGIELPIGAVENDTEDLVYFGKRERRPQDVEAPGLWTHDWVEDNGKWKSIVQAYLASTSAMDHELGRVLDALEESPLGDNTYVLCFSDHGYHLGEKRHWGKATLWELATRVPFIIVGPGIPSGVVCDKPVELLSIYPTVMDYADLDPPHELEGRSLLPLLENVNADWDHPAWTTFVDHHALRTERWRYIRYASGEEELYDTQNDPHELKNLAYRQPDKLLIGQTLTQLRTQLDELLATQTN
ncbi:sulfatase [Opitutia bacterium ISCC 51]|nr:sulfatase [Opitutae bacterium ISCC 51]QXD27386.1 sulfatase [Opitutae bacterium ISCC 52]